MTPVSHFELDLNYWHAVQVLDFAIMFYCWMVKKSLRHI